MTDYRDKYVKTQSFHRDRNVSREFRSHKLRSSPGLTFRQTALLGDLYELPRSSIS